jgi:hypothetical protein
VSTKVQTYTNIGERLDLEVRQGSTLGPLRNTLYHKRVNPTDPREPVDLTGAIVRGMVRKTSVDPVVVAEFAITIAADPADGYYDFGLSASVTATMRATANMTARESTYYWDTECELPSGRVIPCHYGALRIQAEATRDE